MQMTNKNDKMPDAISNAKKLIQMKGEYHCFGQGYKINQAEHDILMAGFKAISESPPVPDDVAESLEEIQCALDNAYHWSKSEERSDIYLLAIERVKQLKELLK